MLAALLANLTGGAGTVTLTTGARLTFILHLPDVTTDYAADQWANPTGRAPATQVQFVPDRPGQAQVTRPRREPRPGRRVGVETQWSVALDVDGATLAVDHWAIELSAGQEAQVPGTRAVLASNLPEAIGTWAAEAHARSRQKAAKSRRVEATGGATVLLAEASFNQLLANMPRIHGAKNPSPAEIAAMVAALRRRL